MSQTNHLPLPLPDLFLLPCSSGDGTTIHPETQTRSPRVHRTLQPTSRPPPSPLLCYHLTLSLNLSLRSPVQPPGAPTKLLHMPFSTLQPRGIPQTALLLKTLPWLSLSLGQSPSSLASCTLPQSTGGPSILPELLADPTQPTQHCTAKPFHICALHLETPSLLLCCPHYSTFRTKIDHPVLSTQTE